MPRGERRRTDGAGKLRFTEAQLQPFRSRGACCEIYLLIVERYILLDLG